MIYLNKNRKISSDEWRSAMVSLGLDKKLETAKRIIIKPNFASGTTADPKLHIITDLEFISNVVFNLLTENSGATVIIAEGDSTGNGFAYEKFNHLGLPESLKLPPEMQSRVELLDLTRDRLTLVEDEKLKYFVNVDKQLWLSEKLLNADFVISLSNLKTHSVTGYTGACKNLFGCLPAFDKSVYHTHIHKVVHDVTAVIKPQLNIVDAFYGMERNGPCQGIDVDSGYRVFSDNPAEADYYAAQTVGIRPFSVKYIKYLFKTLNITPDNDMKAPVVRKYKKPQTFLRVMNRIGLGIQICGQGIASFGHRVHSSYNPLILLIVIFRPLLLKTFGRERLKRMKRKLLG